MISARIGAVLVLGLIVAALGVTGEPSAGFALVPEDGREYAGKTRLELPQTGVSFEVPAGWVGVKTGPTGFMIGKPGFDALVIVMIEPMNEQAARAALLQPPPFGEFVMSPAGEVEKKGKRLSMRYRVAGPAPVPMSGDGTIVLGDHGSALIIASLATNETASEVKAAATAVEASAKFAKPAAAAKSTTGAGWRAELGGRKLVRFYTVDGYQEKEEYWVCSDGTFRRRSEIGGFGGGTSMAGQAGNVGRWSVSGTPPSGVITLQHPDGSTSSHQVQLNDGKLLIDGQRWLRDSNDVCR